MEQITITAKVQIVATDTDKVLLDETMSVYCDACNYVSDYVFRTHDLKQFSLNKILYSTLREKFSLKSQMAQSVFKTVIARYKTILENQNEWIKPFFKKPQHLGHSGTVPAGVAAHRGTDAARPLSYLHGRSAHDRRGEVPAPSLALLLRARVPALFADHERHRKTLAADACGALPRHCQRTRRKSCRARRQGNEVVCIGLRH